MKLNGPALLVILGLSITSVSILEFFILPSSFTECNATDPPEISVSSPPKNPPSQNSKMNQNQQEFELEFNGSLAWDHLVNQVKIGYRTPGSPQIERTRSYIINELLKYHWEFKFHNFTYNGVHISNILAFPANTSHNDVVLFGAHYDTRWCADNDPVVENKKKPLLGANDGASGVAILLELSKIYENKSRIALLFIDAEDQGNIAGWDWIVGSTEFAKPENLDNYFPNGKDSIEAFVLFDMIGDWNLNIINEGYSNSSLKQEIWFAAGVLDYSNNFTNSLSFITDDHRPFIDVGIPAIDLIDFGTGLYVDENGWNLHHTTRDNLDYVREESLWIVGQTIEYWFNNRAT